MVIAYAQSGYFEEAFRFYKEQRNLSIGCNEFSFAGVLTVCVKSRKLQLARQESKPVTSKYAQILGLITSKWLYATCCEVIDPLVIQSLYNMRY
ncbi:hypothetical protein GOBAR_DD12364 [Gossypium barbadense]|nr:hypothetical protein GOBAR_DD12364 [Gossypium barbadense]